MKVNKIIGLSLSLAMTASLVLPVATMAKEKDNKNKNDDEQSESVKVNTKVDVEARVKAVPPGICKNIARGHIPFGWWKKWAGLVNVDINNCKPNGNGTTTPNTDTTAPVISDITKYTGNTIAIITWNTSEKSNSRIFWLSTSTPFATSSANVTVSFALGTHHIAIIHGLTAGTDYRAQVEARDAAGNVGLSEQFNFTTTGTTTPPADTTAPVISSISQNVSSTSVNVMWHTNENADSKVFYSTTTPINTSTASFVSSASFVANHSLNLNGLATGTLYYMQIVSKDSVGNTATSSQFSTTTLSL